MENRREQIKSGKQAKNLINRNSRKQRRAKKMRDYNKIILQNFSELKNMNF